MQQTKNNNIRQMVIINKKYIKKIKNTFKSTVEII